MCRERIYQEYTSRSTWKVIDAVLDNAFCYTAMKEWKEDLIKLDAFTAKQLVVWLNQVDYVWSDISDTDWQQVAEELNNA